MKGVLLSMVGGPFHFDDARRQRSEEGGRRTPVGRGVRYVMGQEHSASLHFEHDVSVGSVHPTEGSSLNVCGLAQVDAVQPPGATFLRPEESSERHV